MSTPKEIFLELIRPDGQPERQLRQYEALHMCLTDPCNTYLRGNRKRGTTSKDRWGTTILFPEDAAGITRDAVRSRLKAAAAGRTRPAVPIAAAAVGRTHITYFRHRHRRRHIHLRPVGKAVFGRERLRIDHTQSLLTKQSFAA